MAGQSFRLRMFPAAGANTVSIPIWSTTATVTVTDPAALRFAVAELAAELAAVDAAANRFRPDSEINRLAAAAGRAVTVSKTLNDLVAGALRIARITGGLVDPTVAAAVVALGYDRDVRALTAAAALRSMPGLGSPTKVPGIDGIHHLMRSRRLQVPVGVGLDLGATAKAMAADRAAARIAAQIDGGVLVNLGGDLAVAGPAPAGGWRVAIGAHHRTAAARPEQIVSITEGGLATSAIGVRRWPTAAGPRHHIVDPRTGENPVPTWRSASAVAGSCLDANAATTAAIVLGDEAPAWLDARGIAARLVGIDGSVTTCAGWPVDDLLAAA